MNDKTENLLPCPFCGGTDLSTETMSVQPDDFHDAHIECNECEARGRRAYTLEGWLPNKAEAKDEAVVAWNRRALPAPAVSEASSIGDDAGFQSGLTAVMVEVKKTGIASTAALEDLIASINQHVAAAVHARAEELARTFVRDVAAERDAALAELAALRAQVPQAGAGADDWITPQVAQNLDRQYRDGFTAGWTACIDGNEEALGAVLARVKPIAEYGAAPPAAELPALPDIPAAARLYTQNGYNRASTQPGVGVPLVRLSDAHAAMEGYARAALALRQPQGAKVGVIIEWPDGMRNLVMGTDFRAAAWDHWKVSGGIVRWLHSGAVAAKQAGKEGG